MHAGSETPPHASLLVAARDTLPGIVTIRRRLHRHPERGLQLPMTQEVIVQELRELGLAPALGRSSTSVTAIIEGSAPGRTVLLRADMDALPLQEDTGLEFASEVPGVMHACGHDTHVAMLLGAAHVLAHRRDAFAGRVLLMFQPGEEGYHGAREMIGEGLLDRTDEDPIAGAFAIHISNRYPTRTINIRAGPQMAAGDTIRITVRGRGGHASTPHLALDPVVVAAHVVVALQSFVTRTVDVFDPAVLTIANLHAGTTTNVIPEIATVEGTLRTVSAEQRAAVKARLPAFVSGIAGSFGATAETELEAGYPVTVNDPAFVDLVRDEAVRLFGADAVRPLRAPVMGSEDFSYVLERVPGAIAFLGSAPVGVDLRDVPQNHSNRVVFDEDAMALGVSLYTAVALRALAPG